MKAKLTLIIILLFTTFSSFSQQINGSELNLYNPSKTANGIGQRWSILNMTGVYGNSLQFWAYDNLGCVEGGMCTNRLTITDSGNIGIGLMNPQNKLLVVDNSGNTLIASYMGGKIYQDYKYTSISYGESVGSLGNASNIGYVSPS